MDDYRFYHLTKTPLDKSLPRLLEKVLASGVRCVVISEDQSRIESLDASLWTYSPGAFLPHSAVRDGFESHQPVFLTCVLENPNGAQVLVTLDGYEPKDDAPFEKCLYFFDGNDGVMLETARSFYRSLIQRGHKPIYYKQDDAGGWSSTGPTNPSPSTLTKDKS